jgi:DNA (cytosine-5)-methyltransferase 1
MSLGLIVDNFAGGGGASVGIEKALGRYIDIAINHDPAAILMHKTNHPNIIHYQEKYYSIKKIIRLVNYTKCRSRWKSTLSNAIS